MADESKTELINNILQRVSDADTEKALAELSTSIANEGGISIEMASMFVGALRSVVENDYILLDTVMDLLGSIVVKLNKNGALSDEDMQDIKKGSL